MTTSIPIQPAKRNLAALVDDCDAGWLSKYAWWLKPAGYAFTTIDGKNIYMHRMILDAKPGEITDHINRNRLDNRRVNLRRCTQAQNCVNRPTQSKTGFRGVAVDQHRLLKPRYRATITHKNKPYYGSWTRDILIAAKDFDRLARHYHGEFAVLNFPDEGANSCPI